MIRAGAAIAAGAALLLWPALLNGYPIPFSDTAAFLSQTLDWFAAFDKPVFYGPFLHLLHQRISLWGPVVGQALITSHLLWLVQRVLGGASPLRHLLLCAALALLTAAPWVVALLMPDIFAPITVLALFLLGFGWAGLGRVERAWMLVLAVLGITVHLSHLVIAAALLPVVAVLARRLAPLLRMALPLCIALALLVASNAVVFGRAAVSPYGAVFLLARLVADGPAAAVIRARCPAAGWALCGFANRLPADSDVFLWNPDGPVWAQADGSRRPGGAMALAPEAQTIIAATLWEQPGAVAIAATRNMLRQLAMAGLGDTLRRSNLGTQRPEPDIWYRLQPHFPAAELRRFSASLLYQDRLLSLAQALNPLHAAALVLAAMLALLALWRADDPLRRGLLACVVVSVLANAFATGALSGPHDRYQARIAWLLLAAVLCLSRWPGTAPRRPPTTGSQ